jgi:hypothetical protein
MVENKMEGFSPQDAEKEEQNSAALREIKKSSPAKTRRRGDAEMGRGGERGAKLCAFASLREIKKKSSPAKARRRGDEEKEEQTSAPLRLCGRKKEFSRQGARARRWGERGAKLCGSAARMLISTNIGLINPLCPLPWGQAIIPLYVNSRNLG